jgi:hypothetical protein
VANFWISGQKPEVEVYPTNGIGLSYGQVDDLPLPDLVAITTDDGQDGYAFSLQLNGRPPIDGGTRDPQARREVPVYDLELQHVLGVRTL